MRLGSSTFRSARPRRVDPAHDLFVLGWYIGAAQGIVGNLDLVEGGKLTPWSGSSTGVPDGIIGRLLAAAGCRRLEQEGVERELERPRLGPIGVGDLSARCLGP